MVNCEYGISGNPIFYISNSKHSVTHERAYQRKTVHFHSTGDDGMRMRMMLPPLGVESGGGGGPVGHVANMSGL